MVILFFHHLHYPRGQAPRSTFQFLPFSVFWTRVGKVKPISPAETHGAVIITDGLPGFAIRIPSA